MATRTQRTLKRQVEGKKLPTYCEDITKWKTNHGMITWVCERDPIVPVGVSITEQGCIMGISFSPDGVLLATLSTMGHVKIWRVPTERMDYSSPWELLLTVRDGEEEAIEEFYCGSWLEGEEGEVYFAVGGKRKDRHVWSGDDDNQVLPSVVKIFDLQGRILHRLQGHSEEVLHIKQLWHDDGRNVLFTCSQDGYVMVWEFDSDWRTLLDQYRLEDGISCMVFSMAPVPGTKNQLLLTACDDVMRLFDLRERRLIGTFPTPFTSYCDDIVFVDPQYLDPTIYEIHDGNRFVLARGVELLDETTLQPVKGNSVTLFKLSLHGCHPKMTELASFIDPRYCSNSWLVRLTVSGSLIAAPTTDGQVIIWCVNNPGRPMQIIDGHEMVEVRQSVFHPYLPLFLTCSDDGMIKVHHQPTCKVQVG